MFAPFLLATIALFVVYQILIIIEKRELRRLSFARPTNSASPEIIRAARVATDLFPITRDLDLNNVEISVVGGDGCYIDMKYAKKLKAGLTDWMSRGASVSYFLTCPSDSLTEKFKIFAADSNKMFGDEKKPVFRVFQVKNVKEKSDYFPDNRTLEKFETLHPTIFSGDNYDAMWIEYNHPRGSMIAHNVKYISPKAALDPTEKAEISKFRNELESVKHFFNEVKYDS